MKAGRSLDVFHVIPPLILSTIAIVSSTPHKKLENAENYPSRVVI